MKARLVRDCLGEALFMRNQKGKCYEKLEKLCRIYLQNCMLSEALINLVKL